MTRLAGAEHSGLTGPSAEAVRGRVRSRATGEPEIGDRDIARCRHRRGSRPTYPGSGVRAAPLGDGGLALAAVEAEGSSWVRTPVTSKFEAAWKPPAVYNGMLRCAPTPVDAS